MAKMQYCGTGRRKSSVARVRLIPGTGVIMATSEKQCREPTEHSKY